MMLRRHLLMNENNGGESPSGYGSTTTEAATNTTQTQTPGSEGNNTQNGQVSGAQVAATEGQQQPQQTQNEKPPAVSGYGEAPPPPAEGVKPPEGQAPAEAVKPLELDLKGVPEVDVKAIQDFASKHKLTKEQAQAFADNLKLAEAEKVKLEENRKLKIKEVYQAWEKELRDDTEFGGAKFDQNVHNVNRVISEHMPGVKKMLTDGGKRLPPSVMRDLSKVASLLYGEQNFVNGGTVQKADANRKPWDFYENKT